MLGAPGGREGAIAPLGMVGFSAAPTDFSAAAADFSAVAVGCAPSAVRCAPAVRSAAGMVPGVVRGAFGVAPAPAGGAGLGVAVPTTVPVGPGLKPVVEVDTVGAGVLPPAAASALTLPSFATWKLALHLGQRIFIPLVGTRRSLMSYEAWHEGHSTLIIPDPQGDYGDGTNRGQRRFFS